MSKVEELKRSGQTIYTRMRPYNPKGGQPHKSYSITPLGKRFKEGEFVTVKAALAKYLEGIYPNKDMSRPPLFEFFSRKEVEQIRKHEVEEERRKRQALLLGEEYSPKKMEPPRNPLPTLEDLGEKDGIKENEELLSLKEEVKKEESPLASISEEDAETEVVAPPPVKESFEAVVDPATGEEFDFEDFDEPED